MTSTTARLQILFLLAVVILLGRVAVFRESLGAGYDVESYRIVAELSSDGKNVYETTSRYNYGPVWQAILFLLVKFLDVNSYLFLLLIVLVLWVADVLIALWLERNFHFAGALTFLLNPVSFVISGSHLQFDNLALALGLVGLSLLGRYEKDQRAILGISAVVFLIASLATKHLVILFLFWLYISRNQPNKKMAKKCVVALSLSGFILLFLPFLSSPHSRAGFFSNVVFYNGGRSTPILGRLGESIGENFPIVSATYSLIAVLLLASVGFLFRDLRLQDQFVVYVLSAFVFSPGLSNQRLILPILAFSVIKPSLVWLFSLVTLPILYWSGDSIWIQLPFPKTSQELVVSLEYAPSVIMALVVWMFVARCLHLQEGERRLGGCTRLSNTSGIQPRTSFVVQRERR